MKQWGLLLVAHPHYQEVPTPSPSPSDGMPLHCKLIPQHFLGLADNMVVPIYTPGWWDEMGSQMECQCTVHLSPSIFFGLSWQYGGTHLYSWVVRWDGIPDGMPMHCKLIPQHFFGLSWQYGGTHLYSWMVRGTVKIKFFVKKNSTQWRGQVLNPDPSTSDPGD